MKYDLGRGVTFHVDPIARKVSTAFWGGGSTDGTRDPTPHNMAEAMMQGYVGADAAWRSLVEHEALHTFVAREVFGCESLVLRDLAGIQPARYALQLHEEALTISAQCWRNRKSDVERPDLVWQGHFPALMRAVGHLQALGLFHQ